MTTSVRVTSPSWAHHLIRVLIMQGGIEVGRRILGRGDEVEVTLHSGQQVTLQEGEVIPKEETVVAPEPQAGAVGAGPVPAAVEEAANGVAIADKAEVFHAKAAGVATEDFGVTVVDRAVDEAERAFEAEGQQAAETGGFPADTEQAKTNEA